MYIFHLKSHERDRGMHLRIWATDFPFSKSLFETSDPRHAHSPHFETLHNMIESG